MKLKYIGFFEVGSVRYSGCLPCGGRRAISQNGVTMRNPYVVIYKGKEYKFVANQILDVPDDLGLSLLQKNSNYQGYVLNAFENLSEPIKPEISIPAPPEYPSKPELDENLVKPKPIDPPPVIPDPVPTPPSDNKPDTGGIDRLKKTPIKFYNKEMQLLKEDEIVIPIGISLKDLVANYYVSEDHSYEYLAMIIDGEYKEVDPEIKIEEQDFEIGFNFVVNVVDKAKPNKSGDAGAGGTEGVATATLTLVILNETLHEISRVTNTFKVGEQLSKAIPDGYMRSTFDNMYLPDGLRNFPPYDKFNWDLIERIRKNNLYVPVDITQFTTEPLINTEVKPDMDGKVLYQRVIPEAEIKYVQFENQTPYGWRIQVAPQSPISIVERKRHIIADEDAMKYAFYHNLTIQANPIFVEKRARAAATNYDTSALLSPVAINRRSSKIRLNKFTVMMTIADIRKLYPNYNFVTTLAEDQPIYGEYVEQLTNADIFKIQ